MIEVVRDKILDRLPRRATVKIEKREERLNWFLKVKLDHLMLKFEIEPNIFSNSDAVEYAFSIAENMLRFVDDNQVICDGLDLMYVCRVPVNTLKIPENKAVPLTLLADIYEKYGVGRARVSAEVYRCDQCWKYYYKWEGKKYLLERR